jgi:hypothetical protein
MSNGNELLTEARLRLQELEKQQPDDEIDWGERIELEPGDSFVGRWRGDTTGRSKDGGTFTVYLFWDRDGSHRFMFSTTRLSWEIDDLKPTVGDEIAVVRGTDLPAQSGKNPTQRYAVRTRPSSDPLPGATGGSTEGEAQQLTVDEDIPF